ncbi:hypothetical protein HK101_003147 [Irineochytrium annulatum]|nr:hypothetical protein HK101_003147 [Irineochytrium annulatum]
MQAPATPALTPGPSRPQQTQIPLRLNDLDVVAVSTPATQGALDINNNNPVSFPDMASVLAAAANQPSPEPTVTLDLAVAAQLLAQASAGFNLTASSSTAGSTALDAELLNLLVLLSAQQQQQQQQQAADPLDLSWLDHAEPLISRTPVMPTQQQMDVCPGAPVMPVDALGLDDDLLGLDEFLGVGWGAAEDALMADVDVEALLDGFVAAPVKVLDTPSTPAVALPLPPTPPLPVGSSSSTLTTPLTPPTASSSRPSNVHTCPTCSKSFTRRFNLHQHMIVHIPLAERTKPYACPEIGCGRSYGRVSDLNRHKQEHEGMAFTCDGCGRGFARRDALGKHGRRCGVEGKKGGRRVKREEPY